MTARYFFYGTLLDAEVRRLVLGSAAADDALEAGLLPRHRLLLARGRHYPVPVRSTVADAPGEVTAPLGLEAAERLAFYEGPDYRARKLTILDARGRSIDALVFLPLRSVAPSTVAWDLTRWQRTVKPRFLKRVIAWMADYQPSTAVLAERRGGTRGRPS